MSKPPPIYFGTVMLEMNRWNKEDNTLTFKGSEWAQRLSDEGFDGMELWQRHATGVDNEEVEKLRTGPCPVKVLNAYDTLAPETASFRKELAELAVSLGANGMKYNSGKDFDQHDAYIDALTEWRSMLPEDFRLMCECHRGSTMADVELADKTLDRLGRENFGMIIHGMDNDEATVRERFGAYGDRIVHIHAAISKGKVMTENEVIERLELLRELGFDGTFTLEFTEGMRDGLTQEELYRNAVRDFHLLRSCMEKL